MPNLQNLPAQVQPITGDASIEAAMAALSPQDQALIAQGIDPLSDNEGPIVNGGVPGVIPNPGMTPEMKMQLGATLQEILKSLPAPASQGEDAVRVSLESA